MREKSGAGQARFRTILLAVTALILATAANALAVEKIVDRVLYPHSPDKSDVYRWSEGSIVSLDGKQHLMMVVTALGFGGHDDTAGDILRADSYDGGRTWTPQDELTVFQKNIGKANVMSPSLLRLDENSLLCFFIVQNEGRIEGGTWMRRSEDNGKTWSEPTPLPYKGYGGLASDRAFLTSKGRILLPVWNSMDGLKSTYVYCLYSDDRGKSWKETVPMTTPKGSTGRTTDPAAEEPTIVELHDGRLMMFMRTYLKSIYVSYSEDGGLTWSTPCDSGIPAAGAMPTIRRMPNGDLLLIWNWAPTEKIDGPWPRNRISSAVSTDDGKTWTSLRHLDGSEDFEGKITMANVTFVGDNAVITYSKSMSKKNAYNWRLQVIPIAWFYEGDKSVTYGACNAKPPEQARRVSSTHCLFLEDALIGELKDVERVLNQPVKYAENPVLTWEKPWEGNCVIAWGSILYDPETKQFRAWYEAYRKFPPKGESPMYFCYATSPDGIRWEKPNLGIHTFRGSTENNIILDRRFDTPTVFLDPNPTPEVKYRMYWYEGDAHGIMSAVSADGVHWNIQDGVRVKAGDRCSAGYDPLRKKFYIITRIPGKKVRTCGLWESGDGMQFEFVKELLEADTKDPADTQLYGMIEFPYQGLHVGFLEPFFIPLRKLDTQLVYSRDGLEWHRPMDRQTFLPWGPPGSWDQAWVTPSQNAPIRVGDKLYVFYQGRQTLHWAEAPFGHIGSIGLAFLRPDGFVSIETQWKEGTVTTVPLVLEGERLHVNAIARPGTVCAEILDAKGQPIEGFSRKEAVPMKMVDHLDHVLTWNGTDSLQKVRGQEVRLKFYVQGAKLFSFWTE